MDLQVWTQTFRLSVCLPSQQTARFGISSVSGIPLFLAGMPAARETASGMAAGAVV
jgi:hypothetical protein